MKAHERRARTLSEDPPRRTPRWFWGESALEAMAAVLLPLGGSITVVGEEGLVSPWWDRICSAWGDSGASLHRMDFPPGGECCLHRVEMLGKSLGPMGPLVAWGGGKCLDSVKWLGMRTQRPTITVPSSSATCAAGTDVVVIHSDMGEVLEIMDLTSAPLACAMDFALLRREPLRLRGAGMADTLAKWVEWSAVEDPEGLGSAEAFDAWKRVKDPGASPEEIWDANLRLSAMASLKGGAAAAAHSFCAGISVLERSRAWLHGEWVGLGLRFQSKLLGQDEEELVGWLKARDLKTALPWTLSDEEMDQVASRILRPDESIHEIAASSSWGLSEIRGALEAIFP